MPFLRASAPVFAPSSYRVRRARGSAALVPEVPSPVRVDTEGLASVDIKIVDGRSTSELLSRPQSDRVIFRGGRVVDTILPGCRELASLFA